MKIDSRDQFREALKALIESAVEENADRHADGSLDLNWREALKHLTKALIEFEESGATERSRKDRLATREYADNALERAGWYS